MKKYLLVLLAAACAAGGVFAQEEAPGRGNGVFSAVGGGIVFDASRSRNTDYGHFWSQIYTGPWAFVDIGAFELSCAFVVGRVARQRRWCFLILAVNISLIWQAPLAAHGITPLFGIALDTVAWARHACLRSDYTLDTLPNHPLREFSAVKLKTGIGRDFSISENRFFRVRLLGYYGRRFGGNPNPFGLTLRLGAGGRG
ncbi:MAG: hypothetical protein FWB99_03255 [Treponema sp.]|nr:hypothetical protein [Treponema sp.]